METIWLKYAAAGKGKYGVWYRLDREGTPVYRIQKAPIIPQGETGYYRLNPYLELMGVTIDEGTINQ
jgi:hypothetical protein